MKPQLTSARLVVKKSPIDGYGVFADQIIPAGSIIEEAYAPVIYHRHSEVSDFLFKDKEGSHVLSFGYGSIYNHSDDPNALYLFDLENKLLIFQAIQRIEPGEEIFVSYGVNWFSDRKINKKTKSRFFWFRRFSFRFLRLAIVLSLIFLLTTIIEKLPMPPSQLF